MPGDARSPAHRPGAPARALARSARLLLAAAALLAVTLLLLPLDVLEALPPLCPSKLVLDRECSGCGMTRALWWLLRGDAARALEMSWRVAIVAPAGALLLLGAIRRALPSRRREASLA